MLIIERESGRVVETINTIQKPSIDPRPRPYKDYYDAISRAIDLCLIDKPEGPIVTDPYFEWQTTNTESVEEYRNIQVRYFNHFGAIVKVGWQDQVNASVHYKYEVRPDH